MFLYPEVYTIILFLHQICILFQYLSPLDAASSYVRRKFHDQGQTDKEHVYYVIFVRPSNENMEIICLYLNN